MKKILLSLSLLSLIGSATLFSSCDAIKKKVEEEADVAFKYDLNGAEAAIEIPIITEANLTSYPDTATVPFSLREEIEMASAALTVQNISKVTITSAKLVFDNCDMYNNASNFKTAMVLFYSNTNPETKYIATNDEVPDVNSGEIILSPDETINLKDYLSSSTAIYYVSGVNMRRPTTKVLTGKLVITYKMEGSSNYGE